MVYPGGGPAPARRTVLSVPHEPVVDARDAPLSHRTRIQGQSDGSHPRALPELGSDCHPACGGWLEGVPVGLAPLRHR